MCGDRLRAPRPRILKELQAAGRPRSVVDAPDLRDAEGNAYRRWLLGRVRGWGRGEGMFQGFPERVDWELAALTPRELADVRYIAWDWVAGALGRHATGHRERQADPGR